MCINRLIDQFIYSIVNPKYRDSMLNIECVIVSLCEKFYRFFLFLFFYFGDRQRSIFQQIRLLWIVLQILYFEVLSMG